MKTDTVNANLYLDTESSTHGICMHSVYLLLQVVCQHTFLCMAPSSLHCGKLSNVGGGNTLTVSVFKLRRSKDGVEGYGAVDCCAAAVGLPPLCKGW